MTVIEELLRIDGVKWWISVTEKKVRIPVPICPVHNLRLSPTQVIETIPDILRDARSQNLWCEECEKPYALPRNYEAEKRYVLNKVDAKAFSKMKTINIDDEAVPLAKAEIKSAAGQPYWVDARLVESKVGRRLVIYVGEKGKKNKVQLFGEPELKRLSFDQRDTHPHDVFLKVEATFSDGSKARLTSNEKDSP